MNIADNIVRHYLKNVYFIGGTACGGKTTISGRIAEKYGFALYDQDKVYAAHRAIATEEYQPATCYPRNDRDDYERFFSLPADVYSKILRDGLHEQAQMVLMDLAVLSAGQPVVADVLFEPEDIQRIVEPDHIVFLTAQENLIRDSYFDRPEKRGFYEFVTTFEKADAYFETIYQSLEISNRETRRKIEESGYLWIKRDAHSTVEDTLGQVERHFKLG